MIFSGLVVVIAFLGWRRLGKPALREALGWITSLVGLLLVYIMSNVYTFATEPAWDTPATPISFFVTTLLLGCLAVGATFVASNALERGKNPSHAKAQSELVRSAWRGLAGASIILLGIQFAVLPIDAVYLATAGSAAIASATVMINPYGWVLALQARSWLSLVQAYSVPCCMRRLAAWTKRRPWVTWLTVPLRWC